ncbi:hypothetical protein HK102_013561 [Quaeritorhiza haematococci]|nr:hypothetical protein HK102_013561 [Quaeritorhiza haematococci]
MTETDAEQKLTLRSNLNAMVELYKSTTESTKEFSIQWGDEALPWDDYVKGGHWLPEECRRIESLFLMQYFVNFYKNSCIKTCVLDALFASTFNFTVVYQLKTWITPCSSEP